MTEGFARFCRSCGGPIKPVTGARGGRPREHCHTCRPSRTAVRRRQRDHEQLMAPCRRCGHLIDQTSRTAGRRRKYCHTCAPAKFAPAEFELDDLLTDPTSTPMQRSVLSRAADLAEAGSWTPRAIGTLLAGLQQALNGHEHGHKVRLSVVQTVLPTAAAVKLAAAVLKEHEVLDDDTMPTIRTWIDRKSAELPAGFRAEIRAWLLELHAGGDRARPRSRSTLYAYFGRVQPHLTAWARTYDHLREVTEQDVVTVLDSQRGHQRAGTFTSLRSLFRFAHRHRIVFTDPTRRLHVGQAPKRSVLPMTDDQIDAVKHAAASIVQRLVVALVAVYAIRAAAVRQLKLEDIDLARRRLRIGGAIQPMPELVHQLLRDWLAERHRLWPHSHNPHVLLSRLSAAGTEPISDYYLSWHLAMQDVPLEHLRADRVLHEAVAVNADPLHLATAFGLSTQTAIDYSEIARSILLKPVEDQISGTDC